MSTNRRDFVRNAALGAGMAAAPAVRPLWGQNRPSGQVNIGVVGFHGRGRDHYRIWAKMPGVKVAYLCDVDERLFAAGVAEVEQIAGYKPQTEVDFRKLIERKDLDAVSIATPDHWHALQTIWGCQAGKDVYVEKPVSYTLLEGRKMVQAARKYNRIVQVGLNRRSDPRTRAAMKYVQDGKLGAAYRAKVALYRGRASIGKLNEASVPEGVHWDLFLGPAPMKPFSLNRFHYGWHFFWETSTTEIGNNGVHALDVVRWGLNKKVHPVTIHCDGGRYIDDDSDQEVPNVQVALFKYADGTHVDLEMTTLYSPPFGGVQMGEFFYTPQGYVSSAENWSTVLGHFVPQTRPDLPSGVSERAVNLSFPKISYEKGPAIPDLDPEAKDEDANHFENFIRCVRSRKREDLNCEVEDGHLSTSLCHLANIAYRTGRKLKFDPATETFPGDEEANRYLTRAYRAPYTLPEQV
ncbi:MAG: Gfo/Idh/MocA family oxidoreductase [Bryobacteraceae bacterium]|nr:Gfo/Idh/MocA family oxidoreductase [Bryobacteraceae bacterium]